jgi:4'-phosphopantetheinyl transferase
MMPLTPAPDGHARLSLAADEVQVWYAFADQCSAPELQREYLSLLSPEELQRHARFAFDHLKAEYLLTRALCRIMLSHYAAVDPAAWTFGSNSHGRPHLLGPAAGLGLGFNLSNTRSLVALAVARDTHELGVDVEALDRRPAPIEIAHRYFSPAERAGLLALQGAAQHQRFFELWTLKEAYIKARGLGLSIPLDTFSMHLQNGDIQVSFDERIGPHSGPWQFALHNLQGRHLLALCVRPPANGPARIRLLEVVPRLEAVRAR